MEFKEFTFMGYPCFMVNFNGEVHAYLNYCPHKGRPILHEGYQIQGDKIRCPFHGAVFSLRTGELVQPPVSKTPCPDPCRLIRISLNEDMEPIGADGELRMPRLPENK